MSVVEALNAMLAERRAALARLSIELNVLEEVLGRLVAEPGRIVVTLPEALRAQSERSRPEKTVSESPIIGSGPMPSPHSGGELVDGAGETSCGAPEPACAHTSVFAHKGKRVCNDCGADLEPCLHHVRQPMGGREICGECWQDLGPALVVVRADAAAAPPPNPAGNEPGGNQPQPEHSVGVAAKTGATGNQPPPPSRRVPRDVPEAKPKSEPAAKVSARLSPGDQQVCDLFRAGFTTATKIAAQSGRTVGAISAAMAGLRKRGALPPPGKASSAAASAERKADTEHEVVLFLRKDGCDVRPGKRSGMHIVDGEEITTRQLLMLANDRRARKTPPLPPFPMPTMPGDSGRYASGSSLGTAG